MPCRLRRRATPGYIFARVQWLRQNNKPEEAGKLILTAPKDPEALVDLDQWWLERRLLVRKLLDEHDAQAAYRVARDAAPPMRGFYRVDAHFTAGWVALRFLHDPKTAAQHFAHIIEGTAQSARTFARRLLAGPRRRGHGPAARRPKLSMKRPDSTPRPITASSRAHVSGSRISACAGRRPSRRRNTNVLSNLEVVRAAEILYALGERDMLASIYAELGESATDVAGMAMLGELAAKHGDGRAMLLLGEAPTAAACRSTITPIRQLACPTISRSPRRSSLRSPIRSRARKATSTRRSSRAPTRWA